MKTPKHPGGWAKHGLKRPKTAYSFFISSYRAKLKVSNPNTDRNTIMKTGAEKWTALSERDRLPFVKQALAAREESVAQLMAAKATLSEARKAPPAGWTYVPATETTRQHYRSCDYIVFSRPHSVADGLKKVMKTTKPTKK